MTGLFEPCQASCHLQTADSEMADQSRWKIVFVLSTLFFVALVTIISLKFFANAPKNGSVKEHHPKVDLFLSLVDLSDEFCEYFSRLV